MNDHGPPFRVFSSLLHLIVIVIVVRVVGSLLVASGFLSAMVHDTVCG